MEEGDDDAADAVHSAHYISGAPSLERIARSLHIILEGDDDAADAVEGASHVYRVRVRVDMQLLGFLREKSV